MRRIRKANIEFISLVPNGANMLKPVYKEDGSFSFGCLSKAMDTFDEKGELLNVVYAPEHRDSQDDIADAEVIKDACYNYICKGGKIDIRHNGIAVPSEKARVGENFLVQKTDERFHGWKDRTGKEVDLTGAWATVIKIDDPELRKKYRSGEWAGVSMGGTAIVDQEKADIDRLIEVISKSLNTPPKPEAKDMDKNEMKELFKELTTEIVKALKPEAPKPEVKTEDKDAPVFKGKLDNLRDVQKHERDVFLYQLKKGTDWNDVESIKSYREAIATAKADWDKEDEAAGISKSSNGPTGVPFQPKSSVGNLTGISKEQADEWAAGEKAAELINKRGK